MVNEMLGYYCIHPYAFAVEKFNYMKNDTLPNFVDVPKDTMVVYDTSFVMNYDTMTVKDTLWLFAYDTTVFYDTSWVFAYDTTIVRDSLWVLSLIHISEPTRPLYL